MEGEKRSFGAIAPYYDELMQGVPYIAWVGYLRKILLRERLTPTRVLDLACGTGNVSELLHAEGFQVTGVDLAPDMIAAARQKTEERRLPLTYEVQDAAELDLGEQRFDLCVSLFDSLNYILQPERLQKAFCRVAAHLVSEGLFVFDMNSEYALVNRFFDQNNAFTEEPLQYDWRSVYFPETRLCRIDMQFKYQGEGGTGEGFEEVHWQYAYREAEVVAMLEQAGFERVQTFQAYTLRATSPRSDRIFYVARRRK